MATPPFLRVLKRYARLVPDASVSYKDMPKVFEETLNYCRENGITRLLISLSRIRRKRPPELTDIYLMGLQMAQTAQSEMRIAIVAPEHHISPDRIWITAARNRGANCEIFILGREPEAIRWLINGNGPTS